MYNLENYISDVEHLLKQRFGDDHATDAVKVYAMKYDLTPLISARFMPSSG